MLSRMVLIGKSDNCVVTSFQKYALDLFAKDQIRPFHQIQDPRSQVSSVSDRVLFTLCFCAGIGNQSISSVDKLLSVKKSHDVFWPPWKMHRL